MPLVDGTIVESLDLHPRVAHALNQRGLYWANEYAYAPYRMEPGGSIDFVALNPQNGQAHIIECKRKITSLTALEDQLYKYDHAFSVSSARKEVYAFDVTDEQRAWLTSRKIDVYTLSMDDPIASLVQTYDQWEMFKAVFFYWHLGCMLPRIRMTPRNGSYVFWNPNQRKVNEIWFMKQYRATLNDDSWHAR